MSDSQSPATAQTSPPPITLDGTKPIAKKYLSPKRMLLILVGGIFLSEVVEMVIMYGINRAHPLPMGVEMILDALIMVVIAFPLIYYFAFHALLTHIEERKRSEVLLSKVLESLPVGVWITDQHGTIQHGNQASQEIWAGAKLVRQEQYGEYKAWWPESGERVAAEEWAAPRAIASGKTILNEEVEIECFDGTPKTILNSAVPILDNGNIQGAIVVNQDITERKQAEQALARNEVLFKTVFQVLPVGAWITDESGKIIFGNPAGQQIWAGARYVGIEHFGEYKAWWLSTGEPIGPDDWAVARAVKHGVTSLNEELEIECFDGSHKLILNSAIPVRDEKGQMYGAFVINEDITQRKQAELLLERQNQDLQDLSLAEGKQRQLAESLVQSMLALNATLELQDVLKTILEQIHCLIPFDLANILLLDGNSIRVVRHLDPGGGAENSVNEDKQYRLDDYPFVKQIITTHQPVLIEDTTTFQRVEAIPGMPWLHSFLSVPLIVGERMIGVINLTTSQVGIYNQEKVRQLMAFAAPAALAIDNARLFTAELQARQLAETLNAVSLALSQTLDFEKVLHTLVDFVIRLVPVDHAYIVIVENETNLSLRVTRGYEAEAVTRLAIGTSFRLGQVPYVQQVMSRQDSVLIEDTREYPGWETLITREAVGSWLGIPILAGGGTIGVLGLQKSEPNFFNTKHIGLAELVAAQAAVSIQNAWLFEQVRAGHERLQSLSRRLVEVQESERRYIARELHDEASQALTALKFGLRLLEQEVDHPENILPQVAALKRLTDGV
ncbi:MAG: GAF domain-containing protein, partial [Anaerolineales bacterium]|nr:GAF domain-containing protein [Anaerolineales bacterium]